MARGDRRESIFEDDQDREMFLQTLGEVCEKARWRVYAWVLMDNHYHWVIQTPEGNLVAGMKWFQNTYTRRLNSRHKLWGHVFGGRYKAVLVEGEEDSQRAAGGNYLATLLDYVHLNPARAGLVSREKSLLDYRWSSLSRGYAVTVSRRAPWLAVPEGLELFGWRDEAAGRRRFVERLEERAREERKRAGLPVEEDLETLQSTLRRGWYWGSQAFQEKLVKLAGKLSGQANRNYRSSRQSQETDLALARSLLKAGIRHFGLPLENHGLVATRQNRPERIALAWALHHRTSQPQKWIAEQLGLRSAANVSQQVLRFQRALDEPSTRRQMTRSVRDWVILSRNVD